MEEQESIIVAIELGSSKISGIAGKRVDGTMQIVAYAEERCADCIKRGVVYNIEKTTQGIRNVVYKVESILKRKISQVYVGLGGQSVHSVMKIVHTNMQTPTCINQNHIDAMTEESHEIDVDDYELIGFYPQEWVVDGTVTHDPVGVVGTNLEGRYLNVIANRKLKANIETCFANTEIEIAGYFVAPVETAKNLMADTEKRSGCVLVDFGAGTTTITVYKNNILRHLSTIPLGCNNIIRDLCSLQIEENEAEELMWKYANGASENEFSSSDDVPQTYTTSDGREIQVEEIQFIILARLNEILANVRTQLAKTEYAGSLLGGLIVTGGGCVIKNMEDAILRVTNVDKLRTAKKFSVSVIKNSTLTNLVLDRGAANTIISLLFAGTDNCVSDVAFRDSDMFDKQQTATEIEARKASVANAQREDEEAVAVLESVKGKLREAITLLQNEQTTVAENGNLKRVRNEAADLITSVSSIIGEDYDTCTRQLIGKDKYKQTLREAEELIAKRDAEATRLEDVLREAAKKNSFVTKLSNWIDDLLGEKE